MFQDRVFLPREAIHLFPRLYRPKPFSKARHLRRVAEALRLSKTAKLRLEWMLWYEENGRNAFAASRHFGIAPKTFNKWRKIYREDNLHTLEDRSKAPKKKRERTLTGVEEMRLVALRKQFLRYGKEKLAQRYRETYGGKMSSWHAQMVIEKYRLYYHPKKNARTQAKRRSAQKKKRITELKTRPRSGFLLCLDTMVRYSRGCKRYVFTAIDKHAKIAFARMYPSKSSKNAADFLSRLHWLLDGKIEHAGHDNGSEFQGQFRDLCGTLGIAQYHSRPHIPASYAKRQRNERALQSDAAGRVHPDGQSHRRSRGLQPATHGMARRVQLQTTPPVFGVYVTDQFHLQTSALVTYVSV